MKRATYFIGFVSICILLLSSCGDPCEGIQCLNGGECVNGNCKCPPDYKGINCETEVCAVTVCDNGVSKMLGGKCYCKCDDGYEGALCDSFSRDKFLGYYRDPDYDYFMTISVDSGIQQVTIDNFANCGTPHTFSINKDSISGAYINSSYDSVTVKGKLEGIKLSYRYTTWYFPDGSRTCVSTAWKR